MSVQGVASVAMAETEIETGEIAEAKVPARFVVGYGAAYFGTFLALLTPVLGGLAVKLQNLYGIDEATRVLGIMMAVGLLVGPLTQPIVGQLSDNTMSRFGRRKPWLVFGAVGFALSLLGVGLSTTFPMLMLFWCLTQMTGNVVQGILYATVADNVPDSQVASVAGIGAAAVPIGKLGAVFALYLLANDVVRLAIPAMVGAALVLFYAVILDDRQRLEPRGRIDFGVILKSYSLAPLRDRDFALAWVTKALIMFGISAHTSYLTLFLGAAFGMSVDEQLSFNLYANAATVVTMMIAAVLGGRASDRRGTRKPFVIWSGILIGMGVVVMAAAALLGRDLGLPAVLLAEALIGAGFGLFLAVDTALCIAVLPDAQSRGKDLGVLNLANTLPGTIAPLLAGMLVIPYGNKFFPGWGYSIWFTLAGVVSVLGGLLVMKIRGVR